MSDVDINVLTTRLDTIEQEVSFARLATQLQGGIETDVDLEGVLEAIAEVVGLLPDDGSGAASLAISVSESDDLGVANDRRAVYAARLQTLMEIPTLAVAARAREVVAEHDKVFHDVRILTDVRPIFGRDASTGVKAVAVGATMKIDYHPGGRSGIESVFVAFDRGDLEHLRSTLNRALTKMDTLSRLMKESNVPRWTSNYHDHGSS